MKQRKKSDVKTQPTTRSVASFLGGITDHERREDCRRVFAIMKDVTGAQPKLWGSSIVGLGSYHYKYASGREGDWLLTGFSPRKRDLTLYIMDGFERHAGLLAKLGKHKTGKSCLYIKRLADVDLRVLRALIEKSTKHKRHLTAE